MRTTKFHKSKRCFEFMDFIPKCSKPLIVILGSTGSGKSRLAIELCRAISGEIVSADSMQLYKGLAIVTNQSTPEERLGVAEHLVGFLSPLAFGYNVHSFRDDGLRVIEDIHRRNKIPVMVGGTNYYIEAMLWDNLFLDSADSKTYYFNLPASFLSMSNEELHETLQKVDPERAAVLHPNNRRRVLRSLQISYVHKCKHSELLREQWEKAGSSAIGGPLRFTNSLILWTQCDLPKLFCKLRERIDGMVRKGLRREITSFYDEELRHLGSDGEPKGAFQCIGVKEFLDFLQLPPNVRDSSEGDAVFERCLNGLHLATCQYAKKQIKWIRNRFVQRSGGDVPPIYALTPSDGTRCSSEYKKCDTCNRLICVKQWQAHVFSKKHRRCKAAIIRRDQTLTRPV
ncbi:tRNA dimethylallyltransferase [Trichuris trichiura]|uniref:tRNA dimethylallyltransferase n=1 Tax=Trichuris trichiura TaxID=36087 RepID=A0A077ZCQ5_TRITR|nr:tRNA dimethylallyltransferase [Trichuris trichiura]